MSTWSQVFADDRVLEGARLRVRRFVLAFAVTSGALVGLAPLATLSPHLDATIAALVCGTVLSLCAGVVMVVLGREYRRLWRIELSFRRFVGYDAAGRRSTLPWSDIDRVDVSAEGLSVTGRTPTGRSTSLSVDSSMPQFTLLAHRAVECAEAHGRTVCVEGIPIEEIDLVALLPSLCASSEA